MGEVLDLGKGEGASLEVVGDDGFVVLPGVGEDVGVPCPLGTAPVRTDGAIGPSTGEVEQGDVAAQGGAGEGLAGVVGTGQRSKVAQDLAVRPVVQATTCEPTSAAFNTALVPPPRPVQLPPLMRYQTVVRLAPGIHPPWSVTSRSPTIAVPVTRGAQAIRKVAGPVGAGAAVVAGAGWLIVVA